MGAVKQLASWPANSQHCHCPPPVPAAVQVQILSVERAFRAVRRCEVAVLGIDASEGITQQDFRLSEYVVS